MLSGGLARFNGRRILLLQGPVGPFFRRFADDLQHAGATVHKVNFHAGDWLFYRTGAVQYRGTMEEWPAWFEHYLVQHAIDVVFLFGDCRPVHVLAHWIASGRGLAVGVFEEGYIRPDYITLEYSGANGYSLISRNPFHYQEPPADVPAVSPVGKTYWSMVGYGFGYFTLGALGRPWFPHYRHHRPLTLLEAWPWVLSAWRKARYQCVERGVEERLKGELSRRYFLVPLQVHNDSQVTVHSDWEGVEHFIEATMQSFARCAPADTALVIKHHPMDRGYRDYTRLIRRLASELGIADRVLYIHDQHLPTLLDHARGVVVINSTVGLSALLHKAPTKVCGNAIYDMEGLTWQGTLDAFWSEAAGATPDPVLQHNFRHHLIRQTQVNGSYYKRLGDTGFASGVVWRNAARTARSNEAPEVKIASPDRHGLT